MNGGGKPDLGGGAFAFPRHLIRLDRPCQRCGSPVGGVVFALCRSCVADDVKAGKYSVVRPGERRTPKLDPKS